MADGARESAGNASTTELAAWRDFLGEKWRNEVDVADFIRHNALPYTGGPEFLEATLRARELSPYGVTAEVELPEPVTLHPQLPPGARDAYPGDVRRAQRSGLLTGLPEAHGRGRIIGDYRRIALYGVIRLIAEKERECAGLEDQPSDDATIRDRQELREQVRALNDLRTLALGYGVDVGRPASCAREAIQWAYLGYLAAVKEPAFACMSLGRTSTFFDIYLSRDLADGTIDEREAQELIDDLMLKLRWVPFSRPPDTGKTSLTEAAWVTETLAGITEDGASLVTRTSFRMLHTLRNSGSPHASRFVVLWSPALPAAFKRYCAQLSLSTGALRYASDELIQAYFGDDAAIACGGSVTRLGQQAVLCGGHVNLSKCLLCSLNGGRDEVSGELIIPGLEPALSGLLEIDDVLSRFHSALDWLVNTYVAAMNCLHFNHDRFAYERLQMALIDYPAERTMAFGVAGLLEVVDALSAIRHTDVRSVRGSSGLTFDLEIAGAYPRFGHGDERVDELAGSLVDDFMTRLATRQTYRSAAPTVVVLAADGDALQGSSNAVSAVAKLPNEVCQEGVAFSATVWANALGQSDNERIEQLQALIDSWIENGVGHLHVRVVDAGPAGR